MLEQLRLECDECAQRIAVIERQLKYARKDLAKAEQRLKNYEAGLDAGDQYMSLLNGMIDGGMNEGEARSIIDTNIKEQLTQASKLNK